MAGTPRPSSNNTENTAVTPMSKTSKGAASASKNANQQASEKTTTPNKTITSSGPPPPPEPELTIYEDVDKFEILVNGVRQGVNLGFHLDQLKSTSGLSSEAKGRIMTVIILHQLVNSKYDTVKKYMHNKTFILRYWLPYTFIKGNRLQQAPIFKLDNACKQLACAFYLFDPDLAKAEVVPEVDICQVCTKKNHSGPLPSCYIVGHSHVGGACLNCSFHSTGSKCQLYIAIAEEKQARAAGMGKDGVGREWIDPDDADLEKLPTEVLEHAQQTLKGAIASKRPENIPQTPSKRKK